MISQFYQKSKGKVMMAVVAFLCLTSYSCKNTQDSIVSDDTVVKVNLLGVATPASSNGAKTKAGGASHQQDVQVSSVPFSKGSTLTATLTTDAPTSKANGLRASTSRAAAGTDIFTLANGVKYAVLVYDNNGNFVSTKEFNAEETNTEIALNAGTYTFIAYSTNESSVPSVEGRGSLSTASLKDISADLMYFKGSLEVKPSVANTLNVTLKHQYSQVITKISVAEGTIGTIGQIVAPTITPSHASANLTFADNKIVYNGEANQNVVVAFPGFTPGSLLATSTPTLLIHDELLKGATLTFGTLEIGGVVNNNFSFENLNIVPGQRYNLNLEYKVCAVEVVATGMNWNYDLYQKNSNDDGSGAKVYNTWLTRKDGSTVYVEGSEAAPINALNGEFIAQEIEAPAADYGFVFNIYSLDNSFNMNVNGENISDEELQFEVFREGKGTAQTIGFTDGTRHGDGGIPQVWAKGMEGNYTSQTNPLIQVQIDQTGNVTVFGRKSADGELLPMKMLDGSSFKTVKWNGGAAKNDVKITQRVENATGIKGYGKGLQKGTCAN
ncbi:hypothetical protein [Sphingobacterium faecium]|uniref:hypothetical protein n=1 Tax=Sphingobacterium faecium TaxID=34087 RepID=UPI00246979CF|nr:hypothetical protein [Sphingobacterium faecium]MDH5828798.1 hypothetical protein [Sphingobacterium faecium]